MRELNTQELDAVVAHLDWQTNGDMFAQWDTSQEDARAWVASGYGVAHLDGQLLSWYSPENHEQALTLWRIHGRYYLEPSAWYAAFEALAEPRPLEVG